MTEALAGRVVLVTGGSGNLGSVTCRTFASLGATVVPASRDLGRGEALAAPGNDPAKVAQEVKKLREEWKALDAQHAGVPRALWERFDGACEKAYAPAAQHFKELAAQRKLARKQRDEFIAAAAAHLPTLLTETPDLRAVEKWLRETDRRQ